MEHETYRLELVPLSSVRPSKENPRRDFGDIDALADAIRATDGQPFNPIVVGRDGDVYRIADGERRYRAMLQVAGESGRVRAIVCDDITSAHMAVAMLATDDKQQLTEMERARGFQTMLSLGVEETTMARAVRRSVEDVRKAKSVASEAPEQATLDQMIEAASFEDEADQMAVLTCSEDGWRAKATALRRQREDEARTKELHDCIVELGLAEHERCPEGFKSIMWATSATDMRKLVAEHEGEELATWPTAWNGSYWYLGNRQQGQVLEETPEQRERRELEERCRAAFRSLKRDLMEFVATYDTRPHLQEVAGLHRCDGTHYEIDYLRSELASMAVSNDLVNHVLALPASMYEVLAQMRVSRAADGWREFTLTYLPPAVEDGYLASDEDEWLLNQAKAEDARVDDAPDDDEDWED